MIIGVPKEIKIQEYRVGLTPEGVDALSRQGHMLKPTLVVDQDFLTKLI